MSRKAMSLKAKINNYSKSNSVAAQVVLQNYMLERFLERLSHSNYKDNFIIKGGMLIANILGLDTRATMDLDTTLRNIQLSVENIENIISTIIMVDLNDNVVFKIISISPIRADDLYGGYCIRLNAEYDTIVTPLSIDISTGDIITPNPVTYNFSGIFDDKLDIKLWAYNLETVMAEKIETILSRGIFSTRPRDYYDVYILETTQKYNQDLFHEALLATSKHRNSLRIILPYEPIIKEISVSADLRSQWKKYQKRYKYASNIDFELTLESINNLLNNIRY